MRRRNSAAGRRLAVLLLATMIAQAVPTVSYATTTQDKINKAEEEREQLQDQLDDKQDELDDLKGEQNNLKGQLNNLNSELNRVSENLADLEQQIVNKENDIADTQAALVQAKADEEEQYKNLRTIIRYMYVNSDKSYLEAFFTAGSIADFLNAVDLFERVADYGQTKLDEYEAHRKYVESEESRLQSEKQELDRLKLLAQAEQDRVSGLISQTSQSITQYADQISEAEEQARAYEAELKAKEADLKTLRKKLAEEIALSQAAANASWRDISDVTFAEGDRKLLANLIYCEAGGEPYEGQVAVGAVVINRMLSSLFPNTIVGVIYQKNQFSPVKSGRLELALSIDKATDSCYRAADEAMAGLSNVGNCIFFRTPIPGLTGIAIGGHIFY